jgi:hypothetical protein
MWLVPMFHIYNEHYMSPKISVTRVLKTVLYIMFMSSRVPGTVHLQQIWVFTVNSVQSKVWTDTLLTFTSN